MEEGKPTEDQAPTVHLHSQSPLLSRQFLEIAEGRSALPIDQLEAELEMALRGLEPVEADLGPRNWRNRSPRDLYEWAFGEIREEICKAWRALPEDDKSDGTAIAGLGAELLASLLGLPPTGAVIAALLPILLKRQIVRFCA